MSNYKMQKLVVFLADNNIQKQEFAQALNVHPNQVSYWIKSDYFICEDKNGNWFLTSKKRTMCKADVIRVTSKQIAI